ncbi:MAG: DUF87 domain-containing protein [Anaerolineae bacterium]|nr:DUF87 domain-containing protein [Anaerolineae bacterium]
MEVKEQPGVFYLGKRVDRTGEVLEDAPVLYDARDLTTHAVCVGMTGSGKTGLGIVLIEEAALDGIPALVVDPKGDMANLLLTFPDLSPADFSPWVDPGAARRRGLSLEQYADSVAEQWRAGLARWGIDGARLARLRQRAQFTIYTPGSDAGRAVSIVQSLRVPPLTWERDAESLREGISSTVSALLALVDVESDPVTGREHILLATIIEQAWRAGRDVDLAQLIVQVQKPSFDQLGVLPLEVFYPARERMALTLALNGLLASPRFAAWMQGDPLSVDALLRSQDGRPQVAILTLAHLGDAERFFFVTLLLEQLRSWLRVQEGTSSLRALLYMDELYGFMPPYPANPPTKGPLLTLLKQARSQGLGLVLATQNPVDLDYKGLSNAGTWFVGKLQTANDRERLLEGLVGASLEAGTTLDRSALAQAIANLGSRTFLLHNVHQEHPVLFRTRYAMSYLRGPLTRAQIRSLMQGRSPASAQTPHPSPVASPAQTPHPSPPVSPAQTPSVAAGLAAVPPVLPAGIRQYFVPAQVSLEWAIRSAEAGRRMIIYTEKQLVYRPALYGRAQVLIESAKHNVRTELTVSRLIAVPENGPFVDWGAEPLAADVDDLDDYPAQGARFAALPVSLGDQKHLRRAERDFEEYVYRQVSLSLLYHPLLKLIARPDEPESQFKRRCFDAIREERDAELAKLEKRYESRGDQLRTQIRREIREMERDETEYDARRREELISAGESLLNLVTRRRQSRMLSMASRRRRMTSQAKADVEESEQVIDELEERLEDLLDEMEGEMDAVDEKWSGAADDLETIELRPRKSDIYVEASGIAWVPYWDIAFQEQGERSELSLPAFDTEGSPG